MLISVMHTSRPALAIRTLGTKQLDRTVHFPALRRILLLYPLCSKRGVNTVLTQAQRETSRAALRAVCMHPRQETRKMRNGERRCCSLPLYPLLPPIFFSLSRQTCTLFEKMRDFIPIFLAKISLFRVRDNSFQN